MANLYDLKLAMMNVARGDGGAGGLVDLTGKNVPLRRDKAPSELDPPEVGFFVVSAVERSGVPAGWDAQLQFDVVVDEGSEGLEERIADRLEAVLTQPALMAEGVDARLGLWRRRDLSALGEGGRRTELEVGVIVTR